MNPRYRELTARRRGYTDRNKAADHPGGGWTPAWKRL